MKNNSVLKLISLFLFLIISSVFILSACDKNKQIDSSSTEISSENSIEKILPNVVDRSNYSLQNLLICYDNVSLSDFIPLAMGDKSVLSYANGYMIGDIYNQLLNEISKSIAEGTNLSNVYGYNYREDKFWYLNFDNLKTHKVLNSILSYKLDGSAKMNLTETDLNFYGDAKLIDLMGFSSDRILVAYLQTDKFTKAIMYATVKDVYNIFSGNKSEKEVAKSNIFNGVTLYDVALLFKINNENLTKYSLTELLSNNNNISYYLTTFVEIFIVNNNYIISTYGDKIIYNNLKLSEIIDDIITYDNNYKVVNENKLKVHINNILNNLKSNYGSIKITDNLIISNIIDYLFAKLGMTSCLNDEEIIVIEEKIKNLKYENIKNISFEAITNGGYLIKLLYSYLISYNSQNADKVIYTDDDVSLKLFDLINIYNYYINGGETQIIAEYSQNILFYLKSETISNLLNKLEIETLSFNITNIDNFISNIENINLFSLINGEITDFENIYNSLISIKIGDIYKLINCTT